MSLNKLQKAVADAWTSESYTEDFRESKQPHKHLNHAVLHLSKCVGKLAAVVEDRDHIHGEGLPVEAKVVADLIIVTARIANLCAMDLEKLVTMRLTQVKEKHK